MDNSELASVTLNNKFHFELQQGDLTHAPVDAIVNAANSQLLHGGGVAALLVRAGGRVIQEESIAWVLENGPVSHEKPAYTSAGSLPHRTIIHAVGPVWGSGNEDEKLGQAIRGSLEVAEQLGLTSIAFPAISTGIFGYPKAQAAQVIYGAIQSYFNENPTSQLTTTLLIVYDMPTLDAFETEWERFFNE